MALLPFILRCRPAALAALLATAPGLQAASEPAPPTLVEAFQKGPIGVTAQVLLPQADGSLAVMPLSRVPVLHFEDHLEPAFSGEASVGLVRVAGRAADPVGASPGRDCISVTPPFCGPGSGTIVRAPGIKQDGEVPKPWSNA